MRQLGVHQGLAPVLDVARDLRWGRVEETIGEDPYLVGLIGSAYVRGVESAGVIATLKHFAGYSASRAGRNLAPVSIGAARARRRAAAAVRDGARGGRALGDELLRRHRRRPGRRRPAAAHRAAARHATASPARSSPTTSPSTFLQTAARRGRGHRRGGRAGARGRHRRRAAERRLLRRAAGEAVEAGRVEEALVDRALERVLLQKCELGLLDADWSPEPADEDGSSSTTPSRARWRGGSRGARSCCSTTTARCRCAAGLRVAVVGPRADDAATR